MKATFHTTPKSFNEFRQSLAVALQHSGRCKHSDAERAAIRLADTDDISGHPAIKAAQYAWENIETASEREKANIARDGFWNACHDLVHDFLCDAELGADWSDANHFANFCAEHLDGSTHEVTVEDIKPQTLEEQYASRLAAVELLKTRIKEQPTAFPTNIRYDLSVAMTETESGEDVYVTQLVWHGSSQSIPSFLSFSVDMLVACVNGHYEVIKHRYAKPGARVMV